MIEQCSKCKFYGELVDEFRCFNRESNFFMVEECAPENACDKFEPTFKIKELNWINDRYAEAGCCTYVIQEYRGEFILELCLGGYGEYIAPYGTIDQAKDAARKHFNNLVLGFIE